MKKDILILAALIAVVIAVPFLATKAEEAIQKAFKTKIGILVHVKPVSVGDLPRSEKKSTRIFDNRY